MPDSGSKNQKIRGSLIELLNMMEKEDGGHNEVMCNILKICTGHIENTMYKDQKQSLHRNCIKGEGMDGNKTKQNQKVSS